MATDIARLEQICEKGLETIGFELVDLEYVRDQQGWVLRVYIDHPPLPTVPSPLDGDSKPPPPEPSTITLHDCEEASHHLGTVLDVEDVIPNAYRLEVSSPGVKRPLRKERDFVRFVGQDVRVQMQEPVDGRKNFVGRLRAAAEGRISVEVDGHLVQLPLEGIRRARLEVEF